MSGIIRKFWSVRRSFACGKPQPLLKPSPSKIKLFPPKWNKNPANVTLETMTKTKTKTKTKRLKAALPTVPRPQTHTFSESSCQELFKDGNVTQIQRQWQLQIRRQRQRQRRGRQDNTWNTYSVLYFRNPDDSPSPAKHCPEQSSKVFKCVQTCSKLFQTCSNVFKLV